ncbi:MAG: GntR family transcriptional regulator [Anaerotruncus massiliensis (ex Togo et al. 2019)]
MEGTYERYKLIYDYYAARICFGRCAFGDSLPAIPRIASEFHVAVPTVRSALARLEADGLIRVEAKKAARVVYRRVRRSGNARYFVPRREDPRYRPTGGFA